MNIKQAKQEIKDAVRAYLAKTPEGDYRIAPVRQRPMLLIGPPGIGKTHYGTDCQRVRDRACFLYYYAPHETERSRPSVYPKRYIWGKRGFHYGVYDERNYRECV